VVIAKTLVDDYFVTRLYPTRYMCVLWICKLHLYSRELICLCFLDTSHLIWFLEEIGMLSSNMRIIRHNYSIILKSLVFLSFLLMIKLVIQDTSTSLFYLVYNSSEVTILKVIPNVVKTYKFDVYTDKAERTSSEILQAIYK
jgi:hypothetical protein